MHVKISVKYPLQLAYIGFGTVIIVSHDHTGLIEQLKRRVVESNHRFGFDPSNRNTFTGFHIETRRGPTIFVVEVDSVTLAAWMGKLGELMTTSSVRVHYDSSVVFSHRRYEQLDARFTRIILNFPIEQAKGSNLNYFNFITFLKNPIISPGKLKNLLSIGGGA